METNVLKEKLNILSESIPKNQWKYFHRESVKNFIINIELIKEKTEKMNTSEILNNYLTDVELNFEPDIDYSIYLFNSYLKYVVPTYRNQLGFSGIPNRNVLIFLIFMLSIIFILLLKYMIFEILFCFIVSLLTYDSLIKFKKNKVYGFRY